MKYRFLKDYKGFIVVRAGDVRDLTEAQAQYFLVAPGLIEVVVEEREEVAPPRNRPRGKMMRPGFGADK